MYLKTFFFADIKPEFRSCDHSIKITRRFRMMLVSLIVVNGSLSVSLDVNEVLINSVILNVRIRNKVKEEDFLLFTVTVAGMTVRATVLQSFHL